MPSSGEHIRHLRAGMAPNRRRGLCHHRGWPDRTWRVVMWWTDDADVTASSRRDLTSTDACWERLRFDSWPGSVRVRGQVTFRLAPFFRSWTFPPTNSTGGMWHRSLFKLIWFKWNPHNGYSYTFFSCEKICVRVSGYAAKHPTCVKNVLFWGDTST